MVSTHSRPKAAAIITTLRDDILRVSTHSRPKAAAFAGSANAVALVIVSTHSRPKAAANFYFIPFCHINVSTHSRPKAAAADLPAPTITGVFQHTAARRRLRAIPEKRLASLCSFNTQPPEGGCFGSSNSTSPPAVVSTHSRPKAAAPYIKR